MFYGFAASAHILCLLTISCHVISPPLKDIPELDDHGKLLPVTPTFLVLSKLLPLLNGTFLDGIHSLHQMRHHKLKVWLPKVD